MTVITMLLVKEERFRGSWQNTDSKQQFLTYKSRSKPLCYIGYFYVIFNRKVAGAGVDNKNHKPRQSAEKPGVSTCSEHFKSV